MAQHEPDPKLMQLATALGQTRDGWVKLGLQLRDIQFELNSKQREELSTQVAHYLARLIEEQKKAFD